MWGCSGHAAREMGSAWNLSVHVVFRGSDLSLYELGSIEGVQIRGMHSSHLNLKDHRWKPTRLPRPWDSPGKNTGVG